MSLPTPPFLIAMLLALTVHEYAHGLAASLLGDPTAKDEGRLTLNPLAHLDLLGTLMFFVVGFGWAKPVPINPRNFRNAKQGITLTALAGPAANLLLAVLTLVLVLVIRTIPFHPPPPLSEFFSEFFETMLFLNLGLMAFNLLPIAPLDGSNILIACIPSRYQDAYEQYQRQGPMILLTLLIIERILRIPIIIAWVLLLIRPILAVMEAFL